MGLIHGGWLVAKVLKQEGVEVVFTLSGGHIAAIYDGCIREGIRVVDTRHEQAAVHAAEGWAKCTRKPGVALLNVVPQYRVSARSAWEASSEDPKNEGARTN